MILKKARAADKQGRAALAIELYEQAISEKESYLIDSLSLIALYFNCMDLGWASGAKIDPAVEAEASTRAFWLIDEVIKQYQLHDEAVFWREFINYIYFGGAFKPEIKGNSLASYVVLAREDPSEANLSKANFFLEEVKLFEDSHRKRFFLGKLELIFKP